MMRRRIEKLREEQQRNGRSTDYLVMSEYNYIMLRGECYLQSFGSFPGISENISNYNGLKIIRLDLPLDQDVLHVG